MSKDEDVSSRDSIKQVFDKRMASLSPEEKAEFEERMKYYQSLPSIPRPQPATVEEYKRMVGLTHLDPDPTKEDLARLDSHNQTMWRWKSMMPKQHPSLFSGSSFREKEREIIVPRLREFQPFDSLGEIMLEWDCNGGRVFEVKFVKPSTLAEWQSTIYQCATMVKLLKTLQHFMPTSLSKYNFIYQCKTLFKKTTHAFQYDAANFAFVVRTGLGSGGQEVKNKPVDFYAQTRYQLHCLLDTMKQELPQAHYEQVFMLYTLIKDKKRALL